ncbi:MAG: hypothetical protein EBR09_12000 [Proteobacteria bacterium]|nr:hypothetical protein [Pseudomonadota bacterium]
MLCNFIAVLIAMSLRTMLESIDLTSLVLCGLDPYNLLKMSMTSKRMRLLVDSLAANTFASSKSFELLLCQHMRKILLLRFDPLYHQLFYEYALQRPSEKLRFMTHVHVDVGRVVCMDVQFEVPLEYTLVCSGATPSSVEIVVTCWKIVRMSFQDRHIGPRTDNLHGESLSRTLNCPIATVCMEALRFRVCGRQNIELPYAITLVVCNVPVCNTLSARERAVMGSCRMCMHCHQRPRMFNSIDAPSKDYRVLCRTCFAHLFVPEYSLQNTWRISKARLFEARKNFVVYNFVSGGEDNTQRFHSVVLKLELAQALGAPNWDEFIRRNYKHPLPFSRLQQFGTQRYKWASLPWIAN